jgi:L-ascorbate metabolism protein UlaG (beta-lactamase superfamily)
MITYKITRLILVLVIVVINISGCKADNTPPSITDVLLSDIVNTLPNLEGVTRDPSSIGLNSNGVVSASWKTDELASSQVEYGTTNEYGFTTPLSEKLVTNHTVPLEGLETGVTYHVRILSRDARGNLATSSDYTCGWCSLLAATIPKISPYDQLADASEKLPPDYFSSIDTYSFLKWIERGFQYYPPSEGRKRDALFLALDLAGISSLSNRDSAMREYIASVMRSAYRTLETAPVSQDVIVYKLYNEGTIIKAPGICIGVDIKLDTSNYELAPGFARMLDALFITHNDIDHYDLTIKKEMEKENKPVILARHVDTMSPGQLIDSGTLKGMQWFTFEGAHLNMAFSGFFKFKIGEVTILHSGDNTRWTDFVNSEYARNIDVFLVKHEYVYGNTDQFASIHEATRDTLDKMKPRFVIPQHLLETYFHGWSAYSYENGIRLYDQVPSETKVQMLHWGEYFAVPPR